MAHEDYKEMLALQALDALEGTDMRELDAHLATCAECRTELDELRDASSLMAYAANQLEPSAELRSRILESVATQKSSAEAIKTARSETDKPSNVIPLARSQSRRWSAIQTFGAIAAALVIGVLLTVLSGTMGRYNSLRQGIAALDRQFEEQRQALEREREARALLMAKDTAKLELAGTPMAKDAHAMLAYNRKTGHAMLMVEGLPAAPADKAYQLWFIAGGKPMPGKVFNIDAAGKAMMDDDIPAAAREHAVFAVTLEPKSGVSAPTGQMYLVSATS
jgi:hypothetical protein